MIRKIQFEYDLPVPPRVPSIVFLSPSSMERDQMEQNGMDQTNQPTID